MSNESQSKTTTRKRKSEINVIDCEPRACPFCIRKKTRCDLGKRPCRHCIRAGLQDECLEDAQVFKMSCFPCKKDRKQCNKQRPCSRCSRKGMQCIPFTPRAVASDPEFIPRSKERRDLQSDDGIDVSSPVIEDLDESISPIRQISAQSRTFVKAKRKAKVKIPDEKLLVLSELPSAGMIQNMFAQGDLKLGEWVDRLLTSTEYHIVLHEQPAFWNSKQLLELARDVYVNTSPMQIYDSLHAPPPKLMFLLALISKLLPPNILSKMFSEMSYILQETFEGMNLLSIQQTFACIEKQAQAFLSQPPLITVSLQPTIKASDESEEKKPNFQLPESYLNLEERQELLKCKNEFANIWKELCPEKQMGELAVSLVKIDPVNRSLQTVLDQKTQELHGYTAEEMASLIILREFRDRDWLSKQDSHSGELLKTGSFV
jgi:hypothetical protein